MHSRRSTKSCRSCNEISSGILEEFASSRARYQCIAGFNLQDELKHQRGKEERSFLRLECGCSFIHTIYTCRLRSPLENLFSSMLNLSLFCASMLIFHFTFVTIQTRPLNVRSELTFTSSSSPAYQPQLFRSCIAVLAEVERIEDAQNKEHMREKGDKIRIMALSDIDGTFRGLALTKLVCILSSILLIIFKLSTVMADNTVSISCSNIRYFYIIFFRELLFPYVLHVTPRPLLPSTGACKTLEK